MLRLIMTKIIALSLAGLLRLEFLIPALAFTIPFIVSGPQWLTGTVVNCLLFLFAARLPKKNILPVIAAPSIGALLHGVVFGSFTPFLMFFLPFIWAANYVLVFVFQNTSSFAYPFRVVAAALVKFALLYSVANLYFGFHIVPQLFVSSMGVLQLVTAVAGGILSYSIIIVAKNKHE